MAAVSLFVKAQQLDIQIAKLVVQNTVDDLPAWDSLDFWLFVGCCCRLAQSSVVLYVEDGVWGVLHIGIHPARRCGALFVGCDLANITDEVSNSFEDPEQLQTVLSNSARHHNSMSHFGLHAPVEFVNAHITFRGFNAEAWMLTIADEWASITNWPDPPVDYKSDPREYRQLLLIDLNTGLSPEEASMYTRGEMKREFQTLTRLPEIWRMDLAQKLELIDGNGFCVWCDTDMKECDDLLRHFMSCAPRCPLCQNVDHRVAQATFCRSFYSQKKAVVLFEDAFFVMPGRAESILRGQGAGVLMSCGRCTNCIVYRGGMRPGSFASAEQRPFSTQIFLRRANEGVRLDAKLVLVVNGYTISIITTNCDKCGAWLGYGVKNCANCQGKFCGTKSCLSKHKCRQNRVEQINLT